MAKKRKSFDLSKVLPVIAAGAEKLLAFLAKKGFIEYKFDGVTERVFQRQCFFHEEVKGKSQPRVIPGFVRIFTSIEGTDFRAAGEDAIRIQGVILNDPALAPTEMHQVKIVYNEKVLRTKNNICKRTIIKARKAWWAVVAAWQEPTPPWEQTRAVTTSAEKNAGPTQKQRDYYKALTGNDLPADCNMKKASELISEAKANGAKPQGPYTGPRRRKGKFVPPPVGNWRDKPVSDAQIRFASILKKKIEKMGWQVNTDPSQWKAKGMTAGQASLVIEKLKAKAAGPQS